MSKPVMRIYKDSNDLKQMQKLTQAIWSLDPNYHIGDLAWQRYRHVGREDDWNTAIWQIDGNPVAWGWIQTPGELICQVDPNFPEVAKDVIDWFDKTTKTNEHKVTVLETEPHLISVLEDSLYHPLPGNPEVLTKISLDRFLFPVHLPDKFKGRHIKGSEDLTNRVAVHKAAFHKTRVTEESYLNVMNAYPYDSSLDWVIESPDGEFVASCLIWFDEVNKVGLLEPVGTDPRFRRMGLASSVCKLALNALIEKGAKTAVVVCTSPDVFELYKSIGFEQFAQTKSFHRIK
ncbi:GNAT family N-acetyltransferase [Aureibacillus halotolerans]|uniref:Ribosomal protein S18 acetylase RimI-like enzyme n=1 Tax=Aureibacillus halotolerans TaxID=1508390 RepID=A0A4R6U4U9_9BACI|nr:GNAT family N-acetyltransferase [Aureibacillus halotolerans]TDQ39823.1 ribosomal protein S18 acetylase RimI-like enzyme [Aureibacillus halotolerans]